LKICFKKVKKVT